MTALLVSVRSAAEALAALAGGAALIDAKEPARGSLGRADNAVIREIVAAVAGRVPVSAALGEWAEELCDVPDAELTYVKWGFAGCASRADWRDDLSRLLDRQRRPQVVLTAYADWQCARAPAIEEVFDLARRHPGSTLLVDTHCKDAANSLGKQRPTLLDWLPAPWIADLCARCREAHIKIALAGSLGPAEIRDLAAARPDWFAVRGAVCDSDRHGTVQAEKVRRLVELLTPIHVG
jgi:(5-formylfuran-3-yl)methyl phosphate synthase